MYNNRNKRGHNYYRLRGQYLCNDLYSKGFNSNTSNTQQYYPKNSAFIENSSFSSYDISKLPITDLYEILRELNYFYNFSPRNNKNYFSPF